LGKSECEESEGNPQVFSYLVSVRLSGTALV